VSVGDVISVSSFVIINVTEYFAIQNNSVERIPSLNTSGFWDVQEIYHIFYNTRVHDGFHKTFDTCAYTEPVEYTSHTILFLDSL
jgi:hypothetical protein